jgi:hypothetical protein
MSNLKDQIVEKLKADILAEVVDGFSDDLRERIKLQLREEVEGDVEYDEAQQARAEIAREVYEQESDEIKAKVREDIWERYETLIEHSERTLTEFKSTIRSEIEQMVSELKTTIRADLKNELRHFVEKELHSYWTVEMRQILRDELACGLLGESSSSKEVDH